MSVLELKSICKSFTSGNETIIVLNDVNFKLNVGESVALLAPSGSGKSTLLQIAATLDQPSSGNVIIDNKVVDDLSDNEKSQLRSKYLGFIYQFHNLLPDFTAIENVMIPLLIGGIKYSEAQIQANNILKQVKLEHRLYHLPKQLSGGEQQRVAIARAIVTTPQVIFADEPTGNLDPETSERVFDLFLNLVNSLNISLVVATHNFELANKLQKKMTIINSTLQECI